MSSTERRLQAAIVGAGLMGRWHAHAVRRAGSTVAAVVDRDVEAARRLAGATGGARAFTDLSALLGEMRPDVVHICTPLETHAGLALRAVENGSHVLVEKPFARTVAETNALLDAAQTRGALACPVHQFAFQRGVATAVDALPALGEPLRIDFRICSAGGQGLGDAALDALVADILPHPLSVLQALWPRHQLQPDSWTAGSPRPGEINAYGPSGGVAVSVFISLHARPPCCEADLHATGGRIHLDFFHGYAAIHRGGQSRADKVLRPFRTAGTSVAAAGANLLRRAASREAAYPGLATLVARFHSAVRSGGPCPIPPAASLDVAIVRDRLAACAASRHADIALRA